MYTITTADELTAILDPVRAQIDTYNPTVGTVLQMLHDTGLRINEVIELDRWTYSPAEEWTVKLEKGDASRVFILGDMPPRFVDVLNGPGWPAWFSYQAAAKIVRAAMPRLVFNSDSRPTTFHAWRYRFVWLLRDRDHLTAAQIATQICHKSVSSTLHYMMDNCHVYE